DDGSRHLSISQLGGTAAGAFLSRPWLPPSQHSAGDAAISFGITMATNIGSGVLKEFLPDIARAITKKNKNGVKANRQAESVNSAKVRWVYRTNRKPETTLVQTAWNLKRPAGSAHYFARNCTDPAPTSCCLSLRRTENTSSRSGCSPR